MARSRRAAGRKWASPRLGDLRVHSGPLGHGFEVDVLMDGLAPEGVLIVLFAEGQDGGAPVRLGMAPAADCGEGRSARYRLSVAAVRPSADYTVRVMSRAPGTSLAHLQAGALDV